MVIKYIFNRKMIALVNNSKQAPLVGDEVLIPSECFPYEKDVREDKLYIVKQRRFIPQYQGQGEIMCIILDDTYRELDILDEVKNEEYEYDGIIEL